MFHKQPRDEPRSGSRRWSKIKGKVFSKGEPQAEEVEVPDPPDTPIHKQFATPKNREAARRNADLGFTSTDNLSGRATPSTFWSSATPTPSSETPLRNQDQGSTPGTKSPSPYQPRWPSGSQWKNEHEIDGQPVTNPSPEAPQGTSTQRTHETLSQSSPPRIMVELPSERMTSDEPTEMPADVPASTETNQEQEETMRNYTSSANGRDSPHATRHRNGSYSERVGGLPSSPDQHRTNPPQPPIDPARAAATRAFQSQPSSATQRRPVAPSPGNPPYPTSQTDAVPAHLVPLRGASARPEPARPEPARPDPTRPDPITEEDATPERRDRRSDPVRDTAPVDDTPDYGNDDDGDYVDDGQSSLQSIEQHMDPEERRSSGFRDRFRRNGGTQKQHQTLHKPTAQSSSLEDWSRKLKVFQKEHKVPKSPYLDQLGTVLQWATIELEERKKAMEAKDQQIKNHSGSVRKLKDEITRLNSDIEAQKRQVHRVQSDWAKAENDRQTAVAKHDSLQTHVHGVKETLKATQQRLEESDQDYRTALGERDTAQQEAALYEGQLQQTVAELQQTSNSLTRVVGERNLARSECNKYWEEAQQKDLQLGDALKRNKQLDQNLTSVISERDAYKQSSDTALARCMELESEHKDEVATLQAVYSRRIDTINAAAKEKQDELEGNLAAMARSHETLVEEIRAEHAAEIAQRDADAKNLEERFRAKFRSETTRLQGELTALQKRMASYSNMDDYVATPDDEFRSNFLHIAQRINNLNYWVPRPSTYSFDPELDPDSFLSRNAEQGGRNWPKFVRHVCWRIIIRGFFGRPLGFGAFGCQGGDGFDAMDQVYQLFAVTDPKGSRGLILPNTKDMNVWRAGFFQALLKLVRQGSAPDNRYLRLFQANVNMVTNDLVASLQRASGSRLDPQASGEIAEFVEGLGTLALEMASQRAQIYLDSCEHGESANADRFKDESGMGSGSSTVDLMIQPCIRRVGDGRNDLRAERVIVKGDFVSVKGGY
ncbi:hypothetical protein ACHAPT_006928 [Fusarium lateritium]